MAKNIYVFGMLDWQRDELDTIDHAEDYNFISLLSTEELIEQHLGFDDLLQRARQQIETSGLKPDAFVCHWDFPSSCLAPVLAAEYGLPAPSLESVLKCEHKYWARLEQQRVVPDLIPEFEAVDPFDPKAADKISLDFPFWLKPVKGFASLLGFRIKNRSQLDKALQQMREHIGELGQAFDACLKHAELPDEIKGIGGYHAIAEGIISGNQFAPEGYVLSGQMKIHGLFDMFFTDNGKTVAGLKYPADLPPWLEKKSHEACRLILEQVGFDNGCFNVEFQWDAAADKLWIIEVNARISQSHCEMFRKVDGMSNHEIAVSVALGHEPHFPHESGSCKVAAKFYLSKHGDAKVSHVPSAEEIEALSKEFNDALIELGVKQGDQLSELPEQPVYCYHIGDVWIGAESAEELQNCYRRLVPRIPLEFSDNGHLEI